MSDESSVLGAVVDSFGSTLESNVFTILQTPALGWVTSLFGLSGEDPLAAINNQLCQLQSDVTQILNDIQSLPALIDQHVDAKIDASQLMTAVTLVNTYIASGSGPSAAWPNGKPMVASSDMLSSPNNGVLSTVHQVLVGAITDGAALGSGPGYLTTYSQGNPARYLSHQPTPGVQTLLDFFDYYQYIQSILMQMTVEAAHQINVTPAPDTGAPTSPYTGALPPDYFTARNAYLQYCRQIAEQQTFLPFSTAGSAAAAPVSPVATATGGSNGVVFDQQTPIAWLNWNFAFLYLIGPLQPFNLPTFQANMTGNDQWMLRAPASAELAALRSSLKDPEGNPVSPNTIVKAMEALGFNVNLQAIPGSVCGYPFVTQEALDAGNWTKIRSPIEFNDVLGWETSTFYDLLNGVAVTVQLFGTSIGEILGDPQAVASVQCSSSVGSAAPGAQSYLDALMVYQLTSADPPIEEPEPSSLSINQNQNPDGSIQFTASGLFSRLTRGQTSPSGVTIPIITAPGDPCRVYWSIGDAPGASITPDGLLTWSSPNANVTVFAVRGQTLSASLQNVQPPPGAVMPAPASPQHVNIYPRGATFAASGQSMAVTFNGQILYSDGSALLVPSNSPLLTFTEATGALPLDPDQTNTFRIPANAPSGTTYEITVTLAGNQEVTDKATITLN